MKKNKPKVIKSPIPVHCAHTSLMVPGGMKPNPLNPKRHGARKLALYAKIIREGGWRRAAIQELKADVVPVDSQDFASAEAENAARDFGFEIADCREAPNQGGHARYIGVRLSRPNSH